MSSRKSESDIQNFYKQNTTTATEQRHVQTSAISGSDLTSGAGDLSFYTLKLEVT